MFAHPHPNLHELLLLWAGRNQGDEGRIVSQCFVPVRTLRVDACVRAIVSCVGRLASDVKEGKGCACKVGGGECGRCRAALDELVQGEEVGSTTIATLY